MKAPRFSLQRLLASTTLVAFGIGIEAWLFGGPRTAFRHEIGDYAATLGLAAIGAGLFTLFKRPVLGATVFGCTWPGLIVIMKLLEASGIIAT